MVEESEFPCLLDDDADDAVSFCFGVLKGKKEGGFRDLQRWLLPDETVVECDTWRMFVFCMGVECRHVRFEIGSLCQGAKDTCLGSIS